jgi:peptidoglycan/LPS O-acetylase OafA/YrhL
LIRLRKLIDRALERRWLGILVLLVLVLLLAFVALHTAHDEAHDSLLLTCVAITVLAACVVASTRGVIRVQPPRSMSWRGPPSPFRLVSALGVAPASPPLRL